MQIHAPRHLKAVVAIGFYTGMREGEILSLTWDKVDFKNRFINLDAVDTKDREKRRIPICNELYENLKAPPRSIHDNHVILYKSKPVKDIRTALTTACSKAGSRR